MINKCAAIRAMRRGLLAVFLVLVISSVSQAGPIGVEIEPYPTIMAGFIVSSYNATTGSFVANGWALTLDTGTGQKSITTPFILTATIENTGVAKNGTLTIGTTSTSPLLGSANLVGFGFNPVQGGVLEFLFSTVGLTGSYVPGTFSGTKPVDVMLSVGNTFMGNFNNTWTSSSNTAQIREDGPADGAPEPSTLLLVLAAAGGLSLRKRSASV